jgi:predicted small secreted protein
MKTLKTTLSLLLAAAAGLILCCTVLSGCNFSRGVKKDLKTGLSFNYNGFRVDDVLLVDPTNQAMSSNKVQLNTKIAIVAIGVSNYGVKDGKAFPGMMLSLTDKQGSPIISAADLFEGTAGFPPEKATELRGNITIAKPIVAGQTYHVKIHIWDKVTPGNEINAEADLVVM